MPIYEYRCEACGAGREMILKPGQQARPSCPKCRKRMKRIISPTAFILKGAGWYVTDYPSQARKKGLEAEKGPAKSKDAGAGSGEKKTDGASTPAPAKKESAAAKPRAKKGD